MTAHSPQLPQAGPRENAMTVVAAWMRNGIFPNRMLERLAPPGHAATLEIVYGAIKWRRVLQWRIQRVATRTPRRNAAALLLTAAYELFVLTDSPAHAVVHENVAIANSKLTRAEAGFVNAVLRGMLRDREAADAALASMPAPLRLSHPDVLWQRWRNNLGASAAERLCAWNNQRAGLTIRPQRCNGMAAAMLERLRNAGVEALPHPARPAECLLLRHGIRIEDIPGYAQGAFSVQDPSTLTAVDLLNPQPHELILDACAAPGGKTAVLADRTNGRAGLYALDINPQRVRRLKHNLARLQWNNVNVLQGDLMQSQNTALEALKLQAPDGIDAVLLDVPCSNTGVLRRKPDARWRFSPETLASLTFLQKRLLSAAAKLLKRGGRLVYSTCSIEPEENSGVVYEWLRQHPEFRLDRESSLIPPDCRSDGAYAALLIPG